VRRSSEYVKAYRQGRRRAGPLFTLHYVPNEAGTLRVGVTVSRKVGNSVVRHRVKRRLLEAFRRSAARSDLSALDVVIHVRPEAATAPYAALRQELDRLLSALVRAGAARP
jgi:ribonuclease P protein component